MCLVELMRWLLHVVIGSDILYEGVDKLGRSVRAANSAYGSGDGDIR